MIMRMKERGYRKGPSCRSEIMETRSKAERFWEELCSREQEVLKEEGGWGGAVSEEKEAERMFKGRGRFLMLVEA